MSTPDDLRARVARGAALLDRAEPGWARRIDVDALAMESCYRCVLGQIFGHYLDGFAHVISGEPSTVLFSAANHGFTAIDDRDFSEFHALADHWRAEVASRVAEDGGHNA